MRSCRAELVLFSLGLFATIETQCAAANPPYQANGVRVGEVRQTSAIVWTRLTKLPERRKHGHVLRIDDAFEMHDAPRGAAAPKTYPKAVDLEEMHGATPGAPGEVRLTYQETGNDLTAVRTAWIPVDPARDFTRKFRILSLRPDTAYT
ncbi:MAG: PhoD-like phosphatase N-terminal domain-containing protein [Planctomycetes bacterium]|nr:PhoD-like phosphatase N-terminal domain-containing protein [Planctomycetota bacterium]